MTDESRLRAKLSEHGQTHLLAFWEELSTNQRSALADDIDAIDLDLCSRVFADESTGQSTPDPSRYGVPDTMPADPTPGLESTYAEAKAHGEQLVAQGKVAAMVVAGGQATRLGCEGPKGVYPIGPVSGKSLFQLHAEAVLAAGRRCGGTVPLYVMTSTGNHQATVDFFTRHHHFGLDPEHVMFFSQAMMPVANREGKFLLQQKHRLALAPNGHGGSLTALAETGMLADMARRGIEHISYFQVDNPLVQPVDPLFVGLHAKQRSEFSSLTIAKAEDDEKVGHFVTIDGQLRVVEYTSFPESLKSLRTPAGERKFDLANIAVHMLDRNAVQRIVGNVQGASLPWHRQIKIVSYIDTASGELVQPKTPNAVKVELFVFDALSLLERTMILHTTRPERFSPVKNPTGVDSVQSAKRDLVRRAARWLETCGVAVPKTPDGEPDCLLEISPLVALDAESLREKESGRRKIEPGQELLLESP